jgi:hypothetical protein
MSLLKGLKKIAQKLKKNSDRKKMNGFRCLNRFIIFQKNQILTLRFMINLKVFSSQCNKVNQILKDRAHTKKIMTNIMKLKA